jgi:2-oxoglutarate/2-oxoacid ferredoxin oxidoreductase subunit alpha
VLIPEMNLGHLALLVRAEFLCDARSITKVQGQRFLFAEVESAILALMEDR